MQEFIWSKIPPLSGPYQYDSNDSRDIKLIKLFDRHKIAKEQFKDQIDKQITEDNNKNTMDEVSTSSSDTSLAETEEINIDGNNPKVLDELSTSSSDDSFSNNVISTPLNSNPECLNPPSPAPSYITHYPDWYFDIMRRNAHDKVFKKVLVAKEWITESLREEIIALSPTRSDITVDNLTQDFSVNPD